MNSTCLMCDDPLSESTYPRHRIVLEDESDDDPNRRLEGRLCRDCWNTFYSDPSSVRIS